MLDFDHRGLRVRHGKRRAPLIAGTRPAPHAAVAALTCYSSSSSSPNSTATRSSTASKGSARTASSEPAESTIV